MATLPLGWEWDYDGSRWLYRYKPTGHVQYHFPNAGDEFPDYIDAASPAPDLAPEERLESQQQVKRHASVSGNPGRSAPAPAEDRDGWKSRMSATAQPVSAVWEDDFEAEDRNGEEAEGEGVFQPENFMFLGPGTYTDVSPLVEEEEEAARRAVIGSELTGGLPMDNNRGVSPMVSQNTTPMVRTSETVARAENEAYNHASTTAMNERAVDSPPITPYEEPAMVVSTDEYFMGDDIVGEASAIPDEGSNYEMYELPVETAVPMHLQYDPVGFVAEMPTEHTAAARVETHPDPIELAANYIMAPIETEPPPGFVELPAVMASTKEGAVREDKLSEEEQLEQRRQEVRRQQEERQRGVQQRQEERKRREAEELRMELQQQQQQQNEPYNPSLEQGNEVPKQFKIARKPTLRESSTIYNVYAGRSQGQEDYQAYAPGQAPQKSVQPTSSVPIRTMSPALQREASLNMIMRQDVAPMLPVDQKRVPSVLQPVRNGSPGDSVVQQQQPPLSTSIIPPTPQEQQNAALQGIPTAGVVKYPSVLRPARGKPGQSPERQDALKGPEQSPLPGSSAEAFEKDSRSSGYKFVAHGQHPPSMTPAPVPAPAPAPVPVAVQPNPPQQPSGIATAQPPAPIQRPYTTAPDLPTSNMRIAHQYAAPPVPPKVAAQLPYPTEPVRMPQSPVTRTSTSTAPYPHDDAPPVMTPYGPLQSQQPARPASAMPVLQHQRRGSGPGQPQQMPIRAGPPPPGSVIVPAGMAPRSATAGPAQQLQQQRQQSHQPGGDPRQNVAPVQNSQPPRPQSVAYPGVYANFASYQTPPPQVRPIQRRATQEEVSPIRSRSQSLSSGALPLDTPSPIDSRRGSMNSIGSQNVNNSYFASTPSSQSSSSVPPSSTSLARPPPQESPQSPVAQDGSKRPSMTSQQLTGVMQGKLQGMSSPQPHTQIQGGSEQVLGGVQRSQSLRQVRTNTGSFPDVSGLKSPQSPTGIGPSNSSHLLTSIQEHDETQHVAPAVAPLKTNQRKVLTKLPPNSTPSTPLNKNAPQQSFAHGAPAPAPLQNQAQILQHSQQQQVSPQVFSGQAPLPRQNIMPGQGIPFQHTMAPPGQQFAYAQPSQMHAAPQPAPILAQAAPILQQGQVQTHAMPMQGFQPVGQFAQPPPQQYQLQQHQHQQQWVAQPLPNSPLAAQPNPLPPLQMPLQTSPTAGGKEKRISWGKLFKSSGSKSAAQSPVVQQPQYAFPPVPIPQPMPGANQPFQVQPGVQQFPVGFQAGQPVFGAPMGQQQMLFQQFAAHPVPIAGQVPPQASPLVQGTSSLHSRDASDAASVSTISSDMKIQPPVNQPFAQVPIGVNTNSAANFSNGMAPAPLFSAAAPSKKPATTPTETVSASQNKWAGKSPVDYSGGGWGDEEDEFS